MGDVCTRTRTPTLHMGYSDVSPWGRDETTVGLNEAISTKSRHMCILISVHSTHAYIYARKGDKILD